jgi:hypothetical protein
MSAVAGVEPAIDRPPHGTFRITVPTSCSVDADEWIAQAPLLLSRSETPICTARRHVERPVTLT